MRIPWFNNLEARRELREYTDMETPQELNARLADEEIRLRSLTSNPREQASIKNQFDQLRRMVNSDVVKTKEIELRDLINGGGGSDSGAKKAPPKPAAIVNDEGQAIAGGQPKPKKETVSIENPKSDKQSDDDEWDDDVEDQPSNRSSRRPNRNRPGSQRPPGPQLSNPGGAPGGGSRPNSPAAPSAPGAPSAPNLNGPSGNR